MRTRQVIRYYCDHCPKASQTKKSMERHEAMCVYNPARVCPLCKEVGEEQRPLASILEALEKPDGLARAREAANHCPACLLAGIVQSRRQLESLGELEKGDAHFSDFDYKAELASWRNDNDEAHGGPF